MTSAQKFSCIFCKDSFDNKEELQIHFRKHGDPKFNQSVRSNKSELSDNMEQGIEGELVICDVCPEVFPTISKAITHKHKVHPDHEAKYFCPWCGKLFTMKHLYNKHIQSNHDCEEEENQTGFHCDYCEVDFFVPSAMLYHNKFFHRQDTELAAIGHSKKLKLYNKEPLQIYYCPFCGDEYSNKVNLHKHMGDDHIDENQSPEDVLRCPLCDAMFYHLDAYELHLTFHSTDDLYSEDNELANDVAEFSLETVPPIMEKVENESQDDGTADSSQIEDFLQQVMNERNDQDNSNDGSVRGKKKKHKKHKKSKKSAITLDEFLTMNTDVFGEGLDFQGIEEVPTQIVAKQLKKKSQTQKSRPGPKPLSSADLAKLKKQGIVVKKKSTKNVTQFQGTNVGNKKSINIAPTQITNVMKKIDQNKPNIQGTSNAILSKLLNQSNTQIRILKTSAQGSTNTEILPMDVLESNKDEASPESNTAVLGKEDEKDVNSGAEDNTCKEVQGTSNAILSKLLNQSNTQIRILKKSAQGSTHTEVSPMDVLDSNNDEASPESNTAVLDKEDEKDVHSGAEENTCKEIETQDKRLSRREDSEAQNNQVNTKNNCLVETKVSETYDNTDCMSREPNQDNNSLESNTYPENIYLQTDKSGNNSKPNVLRNISDQIKIKSMYSTNTIVNEENLHEEIDEIEGNFNPQTKSDCSGINQDESALIDKTTENSSQINSNKKPLDPLKHLGHLLTVKTVNTTKNPVSPKIPDKCLIEDKTENEMTYKKNINEEFEHQDVSNTVKDQHTFSKMEALKNLGKHITIKSLSQSSNNFTKALEESVKDNSDDELSHNINSPKLNKNNIAEIDSTNQMKNIQQKPIIEKISSKKSSEAKHVTQSYSPKVLTKEMLSPNKVPKPDNVNATKNQSCADILKQLPNVTAKPVNSVSKQGSTQSSIQYVNKAIDRITEPTIKEEENKIEIFNIDDSDDENEKSDEPPEKKIHSQEIGSPKLVEYQNKSVEVLKSISKHITIKHSNSQNSIKNESLRDFDMTSDDEMDLNENGSKIKELPQNVTQSGNDKDSLRNKLKILKGVTVKSNISPKFSNISHNFEDIVNDTHIENYDSDSNTSDKVKISELPDDFTSDDDVPLLNTNSDIKSGGNVIVQEPDNTDSDTDRYDDIDKQIKPCLLKKTVEDTNTRPACLSNLKNMTIKSSKEGKEAGVQPAVHKEKPLIPNQNNQLSIRQFRQTQPVPNNEVQDSNSMQTADTERVAKISNKKNSVNKEVTVQTFKTQTVIQEITTTVTKTIRTVNQTVKQEVRNMNASGPLRPQKIQGVRPNQQNKNFQGLVVRPAPSPMGPRIRNANAQPRPRVSPSNRPNQLVPVIPGVNVVRHSNPNTAIVKRPPVSSSTSSYKPVIGRPLKISPSAAVPATKRPANEETNGPFSCFKKPKESLIPGVDPQGDQAVEHFASSSQIRKSNFTSTSKSVKDNSMVTSTRMKSEYHASSEHLSKLNNLSGLKVVKASQAKQAVKIEENIEVSTSKRSTLDAIERLQKQGLLVKKPRLDESEIHEHSKSNCDDFNDT